MISGSWRATHMILGAVKLTFERFEELGLPVHITELIYESNGRPVVVGGARAYFDYFVPLFGALEGGHEPKAVWDEAAQADAYEELYRIAFASPSVEAITIWDFADGTSWTGRGGILREDLSPKPAYAALDRLLNVRWKTRVAGRTGSDGTLAFRGFYGGYTARVKSTGVEYEFTLKAGQTSATLKPAG